MSKQAVLLIGFNKPHTTRRVFEAIQAYQPPRLYIAVDGARNENDELKCAEVRALAAQVDWKCELYTLFRDKNLGCNLGVSSAVSWFFEHETEGIILEDDCLPNPSFFLFCETLLDRYRNDARISIISGSNFLLEKFELTSDYYYSNMTHIWGWASWRRVWDGYTLELKHYDRFCQSDMVRHLFGRTLAASILCRTFDLAHAEFPNGVTWDYRFFYFNLIQHRLSILPSKNLIENIGFDGTGNSGGKGDMVYAWMKTSEIEMTRFTAPPTMIPFYEGDLFTLNHEFRLVTRRQRLVFFESRMKASVEKKLRRTVIGSAVVSLYKTYLKKKKK